MHRVTGDFAAGKNDLSSEFLGLFGYPRCYRDKFGDSPGRRRLPQTIEQQAILLRVHDAGVSTARREVKECAGMKSLAFFRLRGVGPAFTAHEKVTERVRNEIVDWLVTDARRNVDMPAGRKVQACA